MFFSLQPIVKKVPNCKNCKYSFNNYNKSYCKLYRYIFLTNTNENDTNYIRTEDCRLNDDLCGLNGLNFKEKK